MERILAAPATGTYQIVDGRLEFRRISSDWHELTDEHDAFFMRVYAPATTGSMVRTSGSW